jgi:predicted TIM-barrel fold metal-dependent hydrolase
MLIDIHTHATLYKVVPLRDGRRFITPDELVDTMDQVGIDMAVVLPLVSPSRREVLITCEEVLEACARYPGRLIPFCNLDPRQDLNATASDFSRYLDIYAAHGCKGVGEVTVNLPFDDPLVWTLFQDVEASGLPLIFHVAPQVGGYYGMVDELYLPRLEKTLQRFPKLPFLGHSQPFWAEISADVTHENRNGYPSGPVVPGGRVPELMRKYPNLHGDLSANSGYNAISRDPAFGYRFLEEFQDRLLFGTDLLSPGQKLPQIEYLKGAVQQGRITREAFEKVTWQNANRLLGLGIGE